MCSGKGAPGISTTFSGNRGMSDKLALLLLFGRILSHLAPALLGTPRRRLLPLVGGWGKLVGEQAEVGGGRWGPWRRERSSLPKSGNDRRRNTRRPRRACNRRWTRHRGGDGPPSRQRGRGRRPRRPHRGGDSLRGARDLLQRPHRPTRGPGRGRRGLGLSLFREGAHRTRQRHHPYQQRRNARRSTSRRGHAAGRVATRLRRQRDRGLPLRKRGAARHGLRELGTHSERLERRRQAPGRRDGRLRRLEGSPYSSAVTGVYPGVVDTRMQEKSRGLDQELIGKQLHRMFQGYRDFGMLRPPEEPAELISYLCTPAAGRLSGHIIRLEQLEAIKEGS